MHVMSYIQHICAPPPHKEDNRANVLFSFSILDVVAAARDWANIHSPWAIND